MIIPCVANIDVQIIMNIEADSEQEAIKIANNLGSSLTVYNDPRGFSKIVAVTRPSERIFVCNEPHFTVCNDNFIFNDYDDEFIQEFDWNHSDLSI